MSGLQIVVTRLQTSAVLNPLVPPNKRLAVLVPQNETPPFIVCSQVSGVDGIHLSGQDEYPKERIQVESVGLNFNAVLQIGNAVKEALKNVIKLRMTPLGVKDVDITFTGMDIYDYNDARSMVSRIQDFHVRWRPI